MQCLSAEWSSVTGGYFHKPLPFSSRAALRWHPLPPLMELAWLGVGPGRQPTSLGAGEGGLRVLGAAWSGSATESRSPGRRGGPDGGTLDGRSLPWKCCWHGHFPSSLSSSLSIHSTARV